MKHINAAAPAGAYTHLRILAVEASASAAGEVVGLAHADMLIGDREFCLGDPVVHRFASTADEHTDQHGSCTPASLARAVWEPMPPAALVVYGAEAWDHLPPALTGAIGRITLAKIVQVLLPEETSYRLDEVIDWPQLCLIGNPAHFGAGADLAEAVMRIGAVLLQATIKLRQEAQGVVKPCPERCGLARQVLGGLAPDSGLQAMIEISAIPMPPIRPIPASWDDPHDWHRMAAEELDWIVADPEMWAGARDAAHEEKARRVERNVQRGAGCLLMRRIGPLGPDGA